MAGQTRTRNSVPNSGPTSPIFRACLTCLLSLTAFSLVASVCMAFVREPNDLQRDLFRICVDLYKMGFMGVAGLIGGKAL